jgi:hypothetical protein
MALKPEDEDYVDIIENAETGYEHNLWMVSVTTWVEAPSASAAYRFARGRMVRPDDRFEGEVDKVVGWDPNG